MVGIVKLLVGVPVFRIPSIVDRVLSSLVNTPATVLVIDNNADGDVKDLLKSKFSGLATVVNHENLYCNGAWNQIMEYGLNEDYDLIGLETDANLFSGWYDVLKVRFDVAQDEVWLPRLEEYPIQQGITLVTGGDCRILPISPA